MAYQINHVREECVQCLQEDIETYIETIDGLKAERDRLQGYCETIDKLRAMDQEAANKAWVEIGQLRAAFNAAKAFIDSHVADQDITQEMRRTYAAYLEALKGQP